MTIRECYLRDRGRERTRNGGSRLKREEENDSKREQEKNEGSGKGIERGLLEREEDTTVKRGGRKDFEEREKGFAEGNKKNDLEIKDEKKNGQVRKD